PTTGRWCGDCAGKTPARPSPRERAGSFYGALARRLLPPASLDRMTLEVTNAGLASARRSAVGAPAGGGATSATAYAPAGVGNVAVGFDVLGHALDAVGDRVTLTRTEAP